jgi:signal transduction histidine kinase
VATHRRSEPRPVSATGNASAGPHTRVLAEEQWALRRVATLVASGTPPEDLFGAVAAEVGRLLGMDMAALVRYDPHDTVTVVGTWTHTGRPPPTPAGTRLPLGGRNVTTIVFETGRPARINYDEVSGAIGAAAAEEWKLRVSLGVPIHVEGRLWGVMVVAFTRDELLPSDTEERLASFTELVATAVSNAQARGDLQQLADEQAALRRVATLVARSKPPAEVFAVVSQEVGRLFGSDDVAVAKFDADGPALVVVGVAKKLKEVPLGSRYELDERMAATAVYRTGRSARVDTGEWSGDARFVEIARRLGTVSSVASPIAVDGSLWGSIIVSASEPLPSNAEVRLKRFTELVASAVANTQAREELHQLVDEQAALRRVATLVAQGAGADIFLAVSTEVDRLFGAPAAVLKFEETSAVFVGASNDAQIPVGTKWEFQEGMSSAEVYRTGRSARLDTPEWSSISGPVGSEARRLGIVSTVSSPIIVEGRLWGAMTVSSRDQILQAGIEMRLENFTELVATAIANAEARAELSASRARIVAAGDEAKRRIERDLHDGAQQRLAAVVLRLQRAQSALPVEVEELQAELGDATRELVATAEELRDYARGIHPAVLTDRGLGPALRGLARRSPVLVQLDMRIGPRLPVAAETAVYYVVSEALTNAARHAKASVVAVDVAAVDGVLRVSVRDNGIGGADLGLGSGLVGLRDRVAALAGHMVIESPRGVGTSIRVELPLAGDALLTRPS